MIPLSLGECRVFLLLMDGLSRKEIATALDRGEQTISTHITRIYAKFKVHSYRGLMATVRKNPLVNWVETPWSGRRAPALMVRKSSGIVRKRKN